MKSGTVEEGGWAAIRDEIVHWRELWRLFATTRADHLVVQYDDPKDWYETTKRWIQFLRRM